MTADIKLYEKQLGEKYYRLYGTRYWSIVPMIGSYIKAKDGTLVVQESIWYENQGILLVELYCVWARTEKLPKTQEARKK